MFVVDFVEIFNIVKIPAIDKLINPEYIVENSQYIIFELNSFCEFEKIEERPQCINHLGFFQHVFLVATDRVQNVETFEKVIVAGD